MKTKKLLLTGIVAFVVAFVSACSSNEKGEKYAAVIPSNSDVVWRIDLKSILEKAEFVNSKTKEKLIEETPKFEKYINDPRKTGIDLRKPLYMFGNLKEGTMGATFKVLNAEDLKAFLKVKKNNEFEKRDGKYMLNKGHEIIVFDDDVAIYLSGYRRNEIEDSAFALFNNTNKFVDSREYGIMCEDVKDINFYMNCESLKKLRHSSLNDFSKLKLASNISFEKSEATLTAKVYSDDKEYIKEMGEVWDNTPKTNGRYLDFFDKNSFTYAAIAIDEKLVASFEKKFKETFSKELSKRDQKYLDLLFSFLKKIDGDMAISATMQRSGIGPFSFKFAAKAKDKSILDDLDKLIASTGANEDIKREGNKYLVNVSREKIYMGLDDDNNFYISTMGDEKELFSTKLNDEVKMTSEMKKNYGGAVFNPAPLIPFACMYSGDMGKQLEKLNNIHYYNDKEKSVIKIVTNEKENVLKTFMNILDSTIR